MTRAPDCLGVAVYFDAKLTDNYALASGIGRWARVRIGTPLAQLPPREQQAVLMHEIGHVKLRHMEKRLLNLWRIFWPPSLLRYCRNQEFEADRFAADYGYRVEMMQSIMRIERALKLEKRHEDAGHWHPSLKERIARLYTYASEVR